MNERSVAIIGEPQFCPGQVSDQDFHPRIHVFAELLEAHMQLQGTPQSFLRLLRAARADQQMQRLRRALQKIGRDVCADISGGTGQESSHSL